MRGPLASVVGQGFWYALGNALGKAGGLILLPILTNAAYLTPDDFGRWGVMEVSVQIGIIVVGMQLGTAVLRFYAEDESRPWCDVSAFWTLAVTLAVVGAVGATFVLPALDAFWRALTVGIFLYIAAETLLTVPLSVLRAAGRAPAYTLLLVGRLGIVVGLVYWLLVSRRLELLGLVSAYAVASIVTLVVAIPVASGARLLRPRIRTGLLARMLRFSLPLVLAGIGSMALNAADRYVLIALRTPEEVGLYSLAVKFGGVVNMFAAQPLQLALFPVLFQAAADQRAHLVQSLTRLSVLLFGLLTVLVVLFAQPLLLLIRADPFYLQSTGLIAWVSLGFSLFGISIIFDGVLILYKRTGQTSLWFTVAAVTNVLLNLAVIPVLGALGAAVTTLVSYALLLGGRLWAARGLLEATHRAGPLLGISLITIGICVAAAFLPGTGSTFDLILRLLLLAAWPAVVVLSGWVDADDVAAAMRLARRGRDGNDRNSPR